MRILQLSKKFTFPAKDGESIAVNNLGKALSDLGCEVSLLAMNTSKHYGSTETPSDEGAFYKETHFVDVDNRLSVWGAFSNLFSEESYHIQRFVSKDYENKLIELLKENTYDVIQLETLYLAPYIDTIRKYSKAKVVMRSHNVEYEIWERIAKNTSFLPKRKYIEHLTEKLKRFEASVMDKYDLLLAITQRDLTTYRESGYMGNAINVPIGIDSRRYIPNILAYKEPLTLGFIGSLDWMPNIEGLTWFLENIWEEVLEEFPCLSFHIAGRNTPKWLKDSSYRNVMVHGEVESAKAFMNQHSVMVVPLTSGGGMRVKILEGMALGRVVLSTTIGIEGIHAAQGKNAFITDTVEEFKDAIRACLENDVKTRWFGENARRFIEEDFDNLAIGKKLLKEYHKITGIPVQKQKSDKEKISRPIRVA